MAYLEYGKIDEKTEKRLDSLIRKSYRRFWRRKRTFDLIVTGLLMLILLVPMSLIALAVFIDDPHGSPFYKQVRIGRHGKEFNMFKFRTMYVDADKRKAELMAENDPRITRLGKILRKLSIDEMPQFFNVFIGNMSLVDRVRPCPTRYTTTPIIISFVLL